MKEFFSSYFSRKFSRGEEAEQAREIHEMAHDYFGGNFPNPQRAGCPPPESFRKLLDEKGLPGDDLRNHLFGCSECFNEYRILLRRAKSEPVSKKNAFLLQSKLLMAGGLTVILIALGGLFWFSKTDSNSSLIAQSGNSEIGRSNSAAVKDSENKADENAETNSKPAIENQPPVRAENAANTARQHGQTNRDKNKRQSTVKIFEPPLLAKNEAEIDLSNPVWRDSASGAAQKTVRLEARETRLRVKLPKENPAGVYQVFLVDEFGKTVTEKKLIQAKNQTLVVRFDLRKIGGNQKRLCFAPVGEIPDCVLVNIAAPK